MAPTPPSRSTCPSCAASARVTSPPTGFAPSATTTMLKRAPKVSRSRNRVNDLVDARRNRLHHKLRSVLHEFYPSILATFVDKRDGIMRPEARAIMTAASTPAAAAGLTNTQLVALVKRAGRKRGIDTEAARAAGRPTRRLPAQPGPPTGGGG